MDNPQIGGKWSLMTFVDPKEVGVLVLKCSYRDEIGGSYTRFCMAVFETSAEYKLVSPEFGPGLIIQKANALDFMAVKVPISEKENYGKLKG